MTEGTGLYDSLKEYSEEKNAHRGALEFERVILALLQAATARQGKPSPVTAIEQPHLSVDAVLPGGIDEVEERLAVEVLYLPPIDDPVRLLRRRLRKIQYAARLAEVSRVLVIVNVPRHDLLEDEQFIKLLRSLDSTPLFWFWGYEEINRLAEKSSFKISTAGPSAVQFAISRRLSRDPDIVREARIRDLSRLKHIYKTDGLSLLLGAGVSAGSGLPAWSPLVAALFTTAFSHSLPAGLSAKEITTLASAANGLNGDSPLQVARYLRRAIADGSAAFEDVLSDVLYKDLRPTAPDSLLAAVAAVCVPTMAGPRVHSVVTYNFDDLLERKLGESFVQYSSVYRASGHVERDELPIYHVHGFLPQNRAGFVGLDESLLAFSEEGYHRLYSEPYHWSNIVQLNVARERTCLLLGLSLNDPNLRRLLELAARDYDSPRHFTFMKRSTPRDLIRSTPDVRHLGSDAVEHFLNLHHALQEEILGELGVTVIWFDEFNEMPGTLLDLKSTG